MKSEDDNYMEKDLFLLLSFSFCTFKQNLSNKHLYTNLIILTLRS